MSRVSVGNVADSVDEQLLRTVFEKYGEVTEVSLLKDPHTGKMRGFGFVTLADSKVAHEVIVNLDGSDLNGKSLKVNEVQKPRAAGW